jgi:protein TonB
MAFKQLNRTNRAIGAAGAIAINALLVLGLLSLSSGIVPLKSVPGLVAFDVSRPPPAPPLRKRKPAGATAPTSRGVTKAPSPPKPPRPLPKATPAQPSVDAGSQSASGTGTAAGSGAGQGGQGTDSGSGAGGSGTGTGVATPPIHIAGALTDADYARTSHPRGAEGTVYIAFRVRADGSVDQCSVTRSSGYPAIDAATCRLVEQRFRFRPARDSSGQTIDYTLNTDFTWRPR